MDSLINTIAASKPIWKAIAVTVGGMTGVFTTLFVFFVVIKLFELVKSKK